MASCEHEPRTEKVCAHVLNSELSYRVRFTGRGRESELVCDDCATAPVELVDVCTACRAAAANNGDWSGVIGEPEILVAQSALAFAHTEIAVALPDVLDIQPLLGEDRARFVALAGDGGLYRWDLDHRGTERLAQVPESIDLAEPVLLRVSRDGRFAGIANVRGQHGAVVDLRTGAVTMPLVRDDYHVEHCDFPLAFVEHGGRTVLLFAPAWNRLDAFDAATSTLLTERGPTAYIEDVRPPHYLDYFHCGLAVSPDQQHVVDNGWVWQPDGVVTSWSLARWLDENVWESEDGPSRRELCWRAYAWDLPLCWLDADRVAVYGHGRDSEWLVPSACIFDVRTGALASWFPGPRGEFVFDRVLVALGETTTVWDIERGARLLEDPVVPAAYHPTAKRFVTRPHAGKAIASRLCGIDADAPWNRGVVRDLARAIATDRTFDELPVLGDALQDAGCTDTELLAHCREPGEHGTRCWALDRVLGC